MNSEPGDTRLPKTFGTAYSLERELGRGGMATVYLARDAKHERRVAVKVLHGELGVAVSVERFLHEIRIAATLQHPHILGLIDSGVLGDEWNESKGLPYYVMPFVDGESLRARLDRERQLPVAEALRLAREVADALDYAHHHGVVHRDIKPENVLLQGGHALVTDFGIALAIQHAGDARLTGTGLSLGTPHYMAPEQAAGDRAVNASADIYALGAVTYEMLVGEPPFTGPSPQAVLARAMTDEPRPVTASRRTVPPHVDRAVRTALEKLPADRFSSAAEFAAALGGPSGQGATRSENEPVLAPQPGRPDVRGQRGMWWLAAGLVVAAALAGSAWLFARRADEHATVAAGEHTTLAVLPFLTLTPQADLDFLRVGIADAIITQLANARQLRVRPTSAILAFDGRREDPRRAGQLLVAEYVVTGTVQDVGGRLRVSVQLVGSGDGTPRWGESYELPRSDLLALQDSVAHRVVDALRVRLSEAERERLFRRYTANTAAYEAYLRGRSELARHTEAGTRAALRAFWDAVALDSAYALAWAGLGMASAEMHLRFASGTAVKAWRDSAQAQTVRALALDSSLAEVHQSLAAVARKGDFDWDRTILHSRRALELSSSLELPHYYIAGAFYHLGLLDEAEREVRTGVEVNPAGDHLEELRTHAVTSLFAGRYQDALDALEEADRLGDRSAGMYLAMAQYYSGRRADADQLLRQLMTSGSASSAARARAILSGIVAAAGLRDEARDLVRSAERGDYMDHHVAYSIGVTHAQLGDRREAVQWLERAVTSGFPCYPWYARDPLLAPLRADPDFDRLLNELRVTSERARARYIRP